MSTPPIEPKDAGPVENQSGAADRLSSDPISIDYDRRRTRPGPNARFIAPSSNSPFLPATRRDKSQIRRDFDRLVSRCNETFIRDTVELELYFDIVNALVSHIGFFASLIGIADDRGLANFAIASSFEMDEEAAFQLFRQSENETKSPNPILDSIDSSRIIIINDITSVEILNLLFEDQVDSNKYKCACMIIPIFVEKECLGALIVFANNHSIFDKLALDSLKEIGSNLSTAIGRRRASDARKYAEIENQRLSLERQGILANSIVGVTLLHKRNMVWVNDRLCEMFGGTPEDFVGKPTSIIYPSIEEYEDFGKRAYSEISKGDVYSTDLQLRRLDGSLIWCRVSGRTMKDMREGDTIWVLDDVSERKEAQIGLEDSKKRLEQSLISAIRCLAHTVAVRDAYTAGHQERVAQLSVAIAGRMGFNSERMLGLEMGALIHDIGKIYIPGEILTRAGKISDVEFNLIKTHCTVGFEIASEIAWDWPIAKIILQHHERLDGSGYPNGAKGKDIILESRIISVADTLEAIASHRPYRPALPIETGLQIITENRGSHYDPDVVDICVDLIQSGAFSFEGNSSTAKFGGD